MSQKSFREFLYELDPTPSTPGRTIRAFRRNFEVTLKELEEVTGIKEANLSALENDKIEMTAQYAERIGAVFGIHPRFLLYPDGWDKKSKELDAIAVKAKKLLKRKKAV